MGKSGMSASSSAPVDKQSWSALEKQAPVTFVEEVVKPVITIRAAGMDDWDRLKDLHFRLQTDKARNYISCSLPELESYFLNSKLFPQITLMVVDWQIRPGWNAVVGLAAMMLIDAPQLSQTGVYAKPVRHCFIHAAYVPSWVMPDRMEKLKVPSECGPELWKAMEGWAKKHGACFIYGNVRLDGNFAAFEKKYGLKKQHVVIGKNLEVSSG